jgi:hypothetical protein
MTIEAFCKKTGWPLDEFLETPVTTVIEVLALYGMRLGFGKRRTKR